MGVQAAAAACALLLPVMPGAVRCARCFGLALYIASVILHGPPVSHSFGHYLCTA